MKFLPVLTLDDDIDHLLDSTLVLMKRFETTGMALVMKEDYLALYDIYKRLQEQKQELPDIEILQRAVVRPCHD